MFAQWSGITNFSQDYYKVSVAINRSHQIEFLLSDSAGGDLEADLHKSLEGEELTLLNML